jgi:hypothetical protein
MAEYQSRGGVVVPDPLSTRPTKNARPGAHRRESCGRCGAGPVSRSTMRRWRRWHGCARRCAVTWVSNCAGTLQAEVDALHTRTVALLDNPVMP